MKKKEIVSTAVGAITGFTAMKATHNFVKAHQGKVGIFGIAGRIVIEATVCAATAGFAMTFSDKCINIGTDIYNAATGAEDKKHERPEYHSYYASSSCPKTSGFMSEEEYTDICTRACCVVEEVYYYIEDGVFTDDCGKAFYDGALKGKIEKELDSNKDRDVLYYFDSGHAIAYEICICKCSYEESTNNKEDQNGGESKRS